MSTEKLTTLLLEAEKYYAEGELEKSVNCLMEAIEIDPDPELMIDIAIIYDELNQLERAKSYYQLALCHDSENSRAYYGLATVYDNLKDNEMAKTYYQEAIHYRPDYPEAHFFLANLYDDDGQTDLAIYHYEQTLLYDDQYFYAYVNLGSIYESRGDNQLALELFLKAREIDASNHLVNFNLGVVYGKLGQIEKSILAYEQAITLKPDYSYSYLNLALIYKNHYHDLYQAIQVYTSGIENCPIAVLYYNRGCCYSLLEEYEKARQDLEMAFSLDQELYTYAFTDPELTPLKLAQSNK